MAYTDRVYEVVAKVMHGTVSTLFDAIGASPPTQWCDLSETEQQGYIKGASVYLSHPNLTGHALHEEWRAHLSNLGWRHAAEYDINRKTHPNLLPWEQLGEVTRLQAILCANIVNSFKEGVHEADLYEPRVYEAAEGQQLQFNLYEEPAEPKEEIGEELIPPALTEEEKAALGELTGLSESASNPSATPSSEAYADPNNQGGSLTFDPNQQYQESESKEGQHP